MDFVAQDPVRDRVNQNDAAGFTIAITPASDMPAPVAEIVVYGYVKGDVIYDVDGNFNKYSFSMPGQDRFDIDDDEFVFLHANQSRFGIKSKVETAIGEIRSRIEMDFFCASASTDFGEAFQGLGQTYCPRLRKAYGEWDMAPKWTFLAGEADRVETLDIVGIYTVDYYGDAGVNGGEERSAQVRLTYHDRPISWAVSVESPAEARATLVPYFASFFKYAFDDEHQFMVAGTIADLGLADPSDENRRLGWLIGAGTWYQLVTNVAFTGGVQFTEGIAPDSINQLETATSSCEFDGDGSQDCNLVKAYGVTAGLSFTVNDTTTLNVEGRYAQNIDAEGNYLSVDHVWTVHGNIMWQPVDQIRMGWEVMYGRETFTDDPEICPVVTNDGECKDASGALRLQWGVWYFFGGGGD